MIVLRVLREKIIRYTREAYTSVLCRMPVYREPLKRQEKTLPFLTRKYPSLP
jgi:hypothetical protein